MNAMMRRVVVGTAAVSMALSMAACGKAGATTRAPHKQGARSIGLLLPENVTTRYEKFDRPLIEKKIKELCPDCKVAVRQRRAGRRRRRSSRSTP